MARIKISFRRLCCGINHSCGSCDSNSRCPGLSLAEGNTAKCEHLYYEDVIAEIPNSGFTYHSGDENGKGGSFKAKGITCSDLSLIEYLEINGKVITDHSKEEENDTIR